MRGILFKSTVTYDELETIIIQIEGNINCKPLTYIYKDDVKETITPSHLIYGRRILTPQNERLDPDEELDSIRLTKKMKYSKLLIEHFKIQWKSEYLHELRESHKMKKKKQSIQLGDIVNIEDHTINAKTGNSVKW